MTWIIAAIIAFLVWGVLLYRQLIVWERERRQDLGTYTFTKEEIEGAADPGLVDRKYRGMLNEAGRQHDQRVLQEMFDQTFEQRGDKYLIQAPRVQTSAHAIFHIREERSEDEASSDDAEGD